MEEVSDMNDTQELLIKKNDSIVVVPIEDNRLIVSRNNKNYSIEGEDVKDIVIPILLLLGDGQEKFINELVDQLLVITQSTSDKLYEVIEKLTDLNILEKKFNNQQTNITPILNKLKLGNDKLVSINNELRKQRVLVVCNDILSSKISSYFDNFGLNFVVMNEKEVLERIDKESFDFLYYHSSVENIVITDEINTYCIKNGIPYLISRNLDFVIEVGPLVVPFKTACVTCVESRKLSAMNFPIEQEFINNYMRMNNTVLSDEEVLFPDVAINYSVMEIFKFFTKDYLWKYPSTMNSIVRIDMFYADYDIFKILKNPFCKSCSSKQKEAVIERKTWMTKHNYQE